MNLRSLPASSQASAEPKPVINLTQLMLAGGRESCVTPDTRSLVDARMVHTW